MSSQVFHNVWEGINPASVLDSMSMTARRGLQAWLEFMRATEGITRFIPGKGNQLAWMEFQNKLRAFYFFEHADLVLSLPQQTPVNIHEVLARLSFLEPAASVWIAEGIGRYYADSRRDSAIRGGHLQDTFPPTIHKYLVPLHAGMGLYFAEGVLSSARQGRSIASSLDQFFKLCRANSQPGFAEVACETLGLAARTLYPHRVREIDDLLAKRNPEMMPYFWHGIGRGLYFLPTGFFPGDGLSWRAIMKAQREPPHALGQLNATAGVAWALTLVNLRQPEVLEAFLTKYGSGLAHGDAFANGVQSALVIWYHCAFEDPSLQAFGGYLPGSSNTESAHLWKHYVFESSQFAAQNQRFIANTGHLGELFCYRSLPEWIGEMRKRRAN